MFGSIDPALLISALMVASVPILLAAIGELVVERAGVLNLGVEGMMIMGTWFGAWGALTYGSWEGVAIGVLGGAAGGLLYLTGMCVMGYNTYMTLRGTKVPVARIPELNAAHA